GAVRGRALRPPARGRGVRAVLRRLARVPGHGHDVRGGPGRRLPPDVGPLPAVPPHRRGCGPLPVDGRLRGAAPVRARRPQGDGAAVSEAAPTTESVLEEITHELVATLGGSFEAADVRVDVDLFASAEPLVAGVWLAALEG